MEYVERFDLICLVETHIDESFDLSNHFTRYKKFTKPAIKLANFGRKSGGILVMIHERLCDLVTEITNDYQNIVTMRLHKDICGCEDDVLYLAAYVPPAYSSFYTHKDYDCYISEIDRCLDGILDKFDFSNIICTGDYNARVSNLQANCDVNDIFNPSNDMLSVDIYDKSRVSQDKELNAFGKTLLEMCVCNDLQIINGTVGIDYEGAFTYISEQGYSVVDYFIVSTAFCERIQLSSSVRWRKNRV